MRRWALAAVLLVGWTGGVCFSDSAQLGLIVVGPDGKGFVEKGSGKAFVVFGTNYYDPHTGWAPKLWKQFHRERVEKHFALMRSLGVNCARVFLTAGSFQPTADTVQNEALEKLDQMVEIARRNKIRLILTGPDHWEGQPEYWRTDRYAGEQALQALERFWQVVGRRYRGEPAIFAWDLLNEPHLPWFAAQWQSKWNQWLKNKYGSWGKLGQAWGDSLGPEESWGKVGVPKNQAFSGHPRLRDWQLFREYLADQWVRRQVETIRRVDRTHLITVGYIQWSYPLVRYGPPSRYSAFNPRRQAKWLDFVTMHFYPTMGSPFESEQHWQRNLEYLQAVLAYCDVGKPVILGEFGWYGGGAPQHHRYLSEQQQAQWISAEIETSRPLADGWLSWPFADSPASTDISLFAGLVKADMTVKAWGRQFRVYASALPKMKRVRPKLPQFDWVPALTAGQQQLEAMHRQYVRAVQLALEAQTSRTK